METEVKAECQCGRLSADLPTRRPFIVACHCVDCQRRTGSPFGLLAYYAAGEVTIHGEAKRFARGTAKGNLVETFFCPQCGSTVYVKLSKQPAMIGIALGAIADPSFSGPDISVWEQSKHPWVTIA